MDDVGFLNGPTPYEAELKRRPHDPRAGGIEAVAESGTLNPVAAASLIRPSLFLLETRLKM